MLIMGQNVTQYKNWEKYYMTEHIKLDWSINKKLCHHWTFKIGDAQELMAYQNSQKESSPCFYIIGRYMN